MLIFCILGGIYKIVPGLKELNNPQEMQEQKQAYATSMSTYKQQKANLERDILYINEDIERSQIYNQNSILMQIDPYQKNVAAMSLYVNTGYQVMPEMTYQNPNFTAQVVLAYMNSVNTGELYNYVLNHLEDKVELQYLKEILTVTADAQNGMIFIQVVGRDETRCNRIFELVKENFAENKKIISSKISTHEFDVLNESSYRTVDLALEETQRVNRDRISTLNQSLNEKTDQLKKLKEPENSITTKSSVFKSGVKFMILGAIGGAGLAVLLIFFIDMMNIRIRSEKELRQKFGIKVLGVISQEGEQNV